MDENPAAVTPNNQIEITCCLSRKIKLKLLFFFLSQIEGKKEKEKGKNYL
jgi:hypothetical protein